MLISRGAPLLRKVLLNPGRTSVGHRVTAIRNSSEGFTYRGLGDPPGSELIERTTDICFTFFWYWVCYHFITKSDHLTGEYPWPDASLWTDEELGVPPDDYEPPSRS